MRAKSVMGVINFRILVVCVIAAACQLSSFCYCFEDHGTVPHFERDPVLATVNLKYHPSCSSLNNQTIGIIELPLDTLIINVFEHAAFSHGSVLQQFELLYLYQIGYFVLSINALATTAQCTWTLTTDPPISLTPVDIGPAGKSINDVFVSNYGMEITLTYQGIVSSSRHMPVYDLLSGRIPWHDLNPAMDFINNPMVVTYAVTFPSPTCPAPANFPPSEIFVNISSGQTALNVIESGADIDQSRTFTVNNFFGFFYSVRSINLAPTTSSCQWCFKYSPTADESVPSYFLNVAPNDFTIPVDGGRLTLEYRAAATCNNAQNNLNQGVITDEVRLGSRHLHRHYREKHYQTVTEDKSIHNTVMIADYSLIGIGVVLIIGVIIAGIVLAANFKKHVKIV